MSDFINTIDALGDDVVFENIINGTITEFKDDRITAVNHYAFASCKSLTTVDIPNVTILDDYAVGYCSSLNKVNCPNAETISIGALQNTAIESITLPKCTKLLNNAFIGCSKLKVVDLHKNVYFGYGAMFGCGSLVAVILRSETLNDMNANIFDSNFELSNRYVYVPRALLDSYKIKNSWSKYADRFRILEDYTVDGTITGAMREYCESFSLDTTELTFTDANSKTITVTSPLGILDKITWRSSDRKVVKVVDGVVTPVSDGVATITAECGEHVATCEVTVNAGLEYVAMNILEGVTFNAGYIGDSGNISTGSGHLYTNKFDISHYAGEPIIMTLLNAHNISSSSHRIYYYDANENPIYMQSGGVVSGSNVVIESTVSTKAMYAAISFIPGMWFSGIEITYDDHDNDQIGYIEYTP